MSARVTAETVGPDLSGDVGIEIDLDDDDLVHASITDGDGDGGVSMVLTKRGADFLLGRLGTVVAEIEANNEQGPN